MAKYFIILFSLFLYSRVQSQQSEDFKELSLDSLLSIKVSSASKYQQTSSEAPASVTIITSTDIELFGYETILEALSSVRSFYISYDRNYGYLGVRGFGRPTDYNNRILILINGRTTNENFYGSSFPDASMGINMQSIDRIEIVRGPGSVIYGTGAMFAVINVVTKNPQQINKVEASGSIGSYGTYKGQFVAGNSFEYGNKFLISGNVSHINGENHYYKEYDSPDNNNGLAEKLDWETSYGLFSSFSFDDFTFQGTYAFRSKGVPTASWETVFNNPENKTIDQYGFLELSYNKMLSPDQELVLKGFFNHYNYEGYYPYPDNVLQKDATTNNWFGFESQFKWNLAVNNGFLVGFEFQRQVQADYRLWDQENVYFDNDFPFQSFSLYLNDEWQIIDELSLTAGIRQDYYSNNENNLVPRAALIFNPFSNTTLKLLYGVAYRVPNLYEKYYQDDGFAKANPALMPEKIKTIEFVGEQRISNELYGLFSLYNNKIKNLIDPWEDPADSIVQQRNISSVNSNGLELELNYLNSDHLKFYFNYAYQVTKDMHLHSVLSNSPGQIIRAGGIIPFSDILFATLDAQYETSRKTLGSELTDEFLLINSTISLLNIWDNISLYFSIYNVLNKSYSYPAGYEHLQSSIKQNGRHFLLRINYNL